MSWPIVAFVAGLVLVVAGVAAWSVPAAMVVAGLVVGAVGLLYIDW